MSIITSNVTKIYDEGRPSEVKAIDNISLTVNPGEIYLIMGPSGSGKTTFVTIIGGLLSTTKGAVVIGGEDITKLKEDKLPSFRLNNIGFIFQSFNLLSALSARENVAIPLMAKGITRKKALEKAEELLTKMGLQKRLNSRPAGLSGGEKQRVAIARALITNPDIILADEPTGNVDDDTGRKIIKILKDLTTAGKTVVIVTHDITIKDISNETVILHDGRIVI